jgi:hypothetical protein
MLRHKKKPFHIKELKKMKEDYKREGNLIRSWLYNMLHPEYFKEYYQKNKRKNKIENGKE